MRVSGCIQPWLRDSVEKLYNVGSVLFAPKADNLVRPRPFAFEERNGSGVTDYRSKGLSEVVWL